MEHGLDRDLHALILDPDARLGYHFSLILNATFSLDILNAFDTIRRADRQLIKLPVYIFQYMLHGMPFRTACAAAFQDRNPGNNSWENLESLCVECHEREHRGERFVKHERT